MKRLTTATINKYTSIASTVHGPSTSRAALTTFDLPALPEADWPLLPAVEHAVERAVMSALASGLSLRETIDTASTSLSAIGASLSHDDLLTRIAASGLQRS